MRRGSVDVLDVAAPQLRGPGVLVRTAASLISAGTERAAMEFGRSSLLDKARSRPDLVKQVIQKVRRDGPRQALQVAMSRLEKPVAPGYACAGTVVALSGEMHELKVGDRVACAGAGYATHAELNFVPKNLVVPIPNRASGEPVAFEEAAFTTLGAIALHGVRLGLPQLGDRAVVIGLGAIGLLAVQILRAHGCRVAGVDLNPSRCDLARSLGADLATTPERAPAAIAAWTQEFGADLVLVAAAATSSEPAILAADLAREKGRIVAVGATGLDLPRRTLYHKELSVVVSRSYGPGRYDPEYEEHGRDYPLAHVRWTERENMRAFLELVADGRVDVRPLISHRFAIDDAPQAYDVLERESVLGIVLEYPRPPGRDVMVTRVPFKIVPAKTGVVGVSVIGTGNFARSVLLPALARDSRVRLRGAAAATGLSARSAAEKFGFGFATTNVADALHDQESHAVVIATRHDAHASLVIAALEARKGVFVEKPLCLSTVELDAIVNAVQQLEAAGQSPLAMVGFNRRFAPAVTLAKTHFAALRGPVSVSYRVNAGKVPHGSWVADAQQGGGRILGEVCHFVDLCAFLAGAAVAQVQAMRMSRTADDVMIMLRMENGSLASIAYVADGDPAGPKERIEVFGGSSTAVIEDFRSGAVSARGRTQRVGGRLSGRDKGHRAELQAFVTAVAEGAPSPIPFASAVNSTRATLGVLASLESGTLVDVSDLNGN
jgi:polar amino acid transport system substrate-binding protein